MENDTATDLKEPLRRTSTFIERRRPGRVEYTDPALIALLRNPEAGPSTPALPCESTRSATISDHVDHRPRSFDLTDFGNIRPTPGDRHRIVQRNLAALDATGVRTGQLCGDEHRCDEWRQLLAAEVAKIQAFMASETYPKQLPTTESINALVTILVSMSSAIRRMCLISGRDGTPQANHGVAQAIASLGYRTRVPGEYAYWSDLRALCASLCFYWAVAGAVAHQDFTTARAFMHVPVSRNGVEEPAVSALPLLALGAIEWRTLKGHQQRSTPASDFMFNLFRADVTDAALDPSQTDEDLFDRVEFLISLEFSHQRLEQIAASRRPMWFWVPLGRYVCNLGRRSLLERLAAHENLADSHPLLAAGLLGGTPASAARAVQAMRRSFDIRARGDLP